MTRPARPPAPRTSVADAASAVAGFEPKIVHAYRRQPHMLPAANGIGLTEHDVVVECHGEKVKFRQNEAGHIVATVTTEAAYNRLVKEIPEAYIDYAGGENIPERKAFEEPEKPTGKFLLTNGEDTIVLDDMEDAALREFADEAGLTMEQLPDVLTGDTLKTAIYNLLKTGD